MLGMHRTISLLAGLLLSLSLLAQQQITVRGIVTGENNDPLPNAHIRLTSDPAHGVVTNDTGIFAICVPADDTVLLLITYIGYDSLYKKIFAQSGNSIPILIVHMNKSSNVLHPVTVEGNKPFMNTIDITPLEYIPSTADPLTAILRALGAGNNNELSSQYSVRGGNYDENLVYVNGFEVYRPLLIRSGQQEGLPFPDYDLISSVSFSAGGFDARYGDKLSSVLDIRYKQPKHFESGITASLLGASFYMNDGSDSQKVYYLFGARYKTNQYLLNSLNTEGQYKPFFGDVQGLLGYKFKNKSYFELLGTFSYDSYKFFPLSSTTATGVVNDVVRLNVFFDGQENDNFITGFGGLSYTMFPKKNVTLKFLTSGYHSLESETFDIIGDYLIGQVETNPGDQNYGNILYALGVGSYQNFARNYLQADVANITHNGTWQYSDKHTLQWGATVQHEAIGDALKEWELLDSAGYSLPYTGDEVQLHEVLRSNTALHSMRYSGYVEDTWQPLSTHLTFIGGVRAGYWDLNHETIVSPRFSIMMKPDWHRKGKPMDISLKAALGIYDQPPFYRELRDLSGVVHTDVKSQKSIHFLLGQDLNFYRWDRRFTFTTEVYYKYLFDLIPYNIDNVRIRYFGRNDGVGYAAGIDLRLNGEIVKDAESWVSLSLLQTKENLKDDSTYHIAYTSEGTIDTFYLVPQGYIPRPTDQLVNFGMFFQDYMPGNKNFKVHLNFLFASGLPTGPPDNAYYRDAIRIPPYRRVDIGFSALLLGKDRDSTKLRMLRNVESVWAGIEVFNLLGIQNTISYIWLKDVNNVEYAFPNYLTDRRINFRIIAKF